MSISQKPNGTRPDHESNPSRDRITSQNPLFVYVRMPGDMDPEDRWEKFADPLQQVLEREDLGAVTGGGSQFSEPDEDGNDFVEFCGIDVDIYDAVKGLVFLRRELARLQVPQGTMLLYELDGKEWEEPVYRQDV